MCTCLYCYGERHCRGSAVIKASEQRSLPLVGFSATLYKIDFIEYSSLGRDMKLCYLPHAGRSKYRSVHDLNVCVCGGGGVQIVVL